MSGRLGNASIQADEEIVTVRRLHEAGCEPERKFRGCQDGVWNTSTESNKKSDV